VTVSTPIRLNVSDTGMEGGLVLEVDQDTLTVELATEINNFWGGASSRLQETDGDVRRAVVRLFAVRAFHHILADGGYAGEDVRALTHYAMSVASEEGWPGLDELGIRIVSADVYAPDFHSIRAQEMTL
jgi:hypothetical protein